MRFNATNFVLSSLLVAASIVPIAVLFLSDSTSASGDIVLLSWLTVIYGFVYLATAHKASEKWLDFYPMFLLAVFLFNLSYPVIYSLGFVNFTNDFLSRGVKPHLAVGAVALSLSFTTAFHAGSILGFRLPRDKVLPTFSPSRSKYVFIFSTILAIVASPGIFFSFGSILAQTLTSGYGAFWAPENAEYGFAAWDRVLSWFLIPSIFGFLVAGRQYRSARFIAAGLLLAFVAMSFMIGRRAFAAMALVSFIIIWHQLIWPIRKAYIVVGTASCLVVFSIVSEVRNMSADERLTFLTRIDLSRIIAAPLDTIHEMGLTLRTVYWAYEAVPSEREFSYGQSYLYGTTTLIPNLFWDQHPASEQGVGKWMSARFQPNLAARGGGVGSSFITEAYVNFGGLGWIVCFTGGFLLQRFILWAKHSDATRYVVLGSVFSFLFILARGETQSVVRDIVWYGILPYVLFHIPLMFRKKRRIQPPQTTTVPA